MSLRTAQENFKKAFVDSEKTLTEKFMAELKAYVQIKAETGKDRYEKMLDCMNEKKPLASFLCRNDICDDLVKEMLRRSIPFVLVTNKMGEYGFIIRSSDRALTNEAIKTVLNKLGSYVEIVTGEELAEIVQRLSDKDKGLIAINGLNFRELFLLEKLCRKEGFLDHIAEDEMNDGTYRFMVYGKQAAQNMMLANILFKMIMMTEGSNKEINNKRLTEQIKLNQLRADDFGRNRGLMSPIYIVGSGNQFMKMEQNGFFFGHAIKEDGQIKIKEHFSAELSTPGYKEYEKTYLNRIPDAVATTNISQVMDHFTRGLNERDSLDFGLTSKEKDRYFGETVLISSIMGVVADNIRNDDIMNVSGRWLEKTGHTTFEAGKVLNGLIRNEVPIGYDQVDIMSIRASISPYNLDLSEYQTVSENLRGMIITDEKAEIEFRGNIQDRIDEMREQAMENREAEEMEISESLQRS